MSFFESDQIEKHVGQGFSPAIRGEHVGQGFSPAIPLTRREFVAAAAGTIVAAGAACRRRRPWNAADFAPLPATSDVLLLAAPNYEIDLSDIIGRGIRDLGLSMKGKRVLLKPNMVEYERGTIINTHVSVVAAAADAALRHGAREVVVAEGPGHRRDTEYLVTATGLYDHLRDLKLRFVDLNQTTCGGCRCGAGSWTSRTSRCQCRCSTPTSSCRCPS